jgi:hypothetical protein
VSERLGGTAGRARKNTSAKSGHGLRAAQHFAVNRHSWADKLCRPMNKSETLVADISKAVESFDEKDSTSRQVLIRLASSDPSTFFAAAIHVVAVSQPSEGTRYLILTLAKDKRLSMGLLDPQVCTLQEAMTVVRAAAGAGAQLQPTFEMELNQALRGQASPRKTERILRTLDILSVTCGQHFWNSFQLELMAYPDKIVRSKTALLIGRSTRNVNWIARRLLDRDPRVQASAVEAMWGLDAEETKPHFLAALKSQNNRVAANAALGLYLSGDATAMPVLLDLLRHTDPLFRRSALWAIGETRDERFLPILADYYKHAEGKLRLAAIGAMSRIRRGEKTAPEAGPLQIHVTQAAVHADGLRCLAIALSCHPARDLSGIQPAEFAVLENGKLIEDCRVRQVNPPAVLMVGFIVPWFASGGDAYEKSVREGLLQCLSMKRPEDLWRIDRYSVESDAPTDGGSSEGSVISYDDTLLTPEVLAAQGCLSDPELLRKAVALAPPRERAAPDPVMAFQRQSDAFAKHGGNRHVFLFLQDTSGFELKQDPAVARLGSIAQQGSVVLHGICSDIGVQWSLFRDLCLTNPEGSFTESNGEGVVDSVVDAYANLCSRFEISYSLPATDTPATVELKIRSVRGHAEKSMHVAPAAQIIEPAAASVPAVETSASAE